MIIETGLLDELNHMSWSNFWRITGRPCQWNRGTHKFKINRKTYFRYSLLLGIVSMTLFGNAFQQMACLKLYNIPLDRTTFSFVLILGYGFGFMSYISYKTYQEPKLTEYFLEEIARFEVNHVKYEDQSWKDEMNKRDMTRFSKLTCKLVKISAVKQMPFIVAIGAAVMPSHPINLLSLWPWNKILNAVECDGGWGYFASTWIFLVNLEIWCCCTKTWGLFLAQIVIGCTELCTAVLVFVRKTLTAVGTRGRKLPTTTFRQMQILTDVFNKLEVTLLFILLVYGVSGQVLYGLNLIKGNADIAIKMFFVSAVFNCMAVVVLVFGFCAEVHETSRNCLKKLKRKEDLMLFSRPTTRIREYRQMIRSLPIVKVHFGSTNFIEKMTPVVFQHFTAVRFIDCLLVTKS